MLRSNQNLGWSLLLIFALLINLLNVGVVLADGETPTPPPATEEPTEPPVEATGTPLPQVTPENVDMLPTEEPVSISEDALPAELIASLPENTDIVVLDENGDPLPLASQEAATTILEEDPMWCPAGILPGGAGCTINFPSIAALISNMVSSTNTYDENGVIYFTATAGGSLTFTTTTLTGGDFNTLRAFNLTLQGGWNGVNGGGATFTGQTNFANNSVTIGTSANPWVGDLTINNFIFNGGSSANALTVYTTTGDITLNNVDVAAQSGSNYTAFLQSNSGDINVQNGSTFDGNNSGSNQNRGFQATTSTGAITISNTSFTDSNGCFVLFICLLPTLVNYNGATLSAPTVTLNSVTATNNDLNGIQINNAALVNLNNVTASNNGTDLILLPDSGDLGSGILINGTGTTIVNITGGTFNNNERYGIEALNATLNGVGTISSCTGNDLGCVIDTIPPVLTLPANITVEATSSAGNIVTFTASALDNVDGARPVTCTPVSGSTFPIGTTTVNCSATDTRGNTATGSFTITIQDTTPPSLTLPANMTIEATSSTGAIASFTASASDIIDGSVTVSCLPASGSTFAVGTTTVNCSASDTRGNTANGSFTVTVQDTTPPVISPISDINVNTLNELGALVTYASPVTLDIVDGAGVATCTPTSGSQFAPGSTTVTCTATDSHGNTSSSTFVINVNYRPATTVSPSASLILVTGGELLDLDCFTVANAFGIIVKFHNLCDHQAVLNEISQDTLPGALPAGFTFLQGIDIQVLTGRQAVDTLPTKSGVELDFPLSEKSTFAVLHWNNGQWVEITQLMNDADLLSTLSKDADNELYKMSSSNGAYHKVLTTELTGTFILVKK